MGDTDLRELLAARRTRGGGHDVTQTILEGLLDKTEALEAKQQADTTTFAFSGPAGGE